MAEEDQKNETEFEGVNNEKSLAIKDLHVVLRNVGGDSLYMSVKNKKTKRVFSQTFSKSTLESMRLYQPIDKVIAMILSAQNETVKILELKIGYIDAENSNKLNSNHIHEQYAKGDCLCLIVKQTLEWNEGEFIFKLLEQKRDEVEILHDVIQDLQAEIGTLKETVSALHAAAEKSKETHNDSMSALQQRMEELEQKQAPVHIAKWQSSGANGSNYLKWNVQKIAPTLNGMISGMQNDNVDVVIGVAGLYRVVFRFTGVESTSSSRWSYMYLNGSTIAGMGHYGGNAFGVIIEVLNLSVGDKIKCYVENSSSTGLDALRNSLIIERLGNTV